MTEQLNSRLNDIEETIVSLANKHTETLNDWQKNYVSGKPSWKVPKIWHQHNFVITTYIMTKLGRNEKYRDFLCLILLI